MRHTPSAMGCCHTARWSLKGASIQVWRSAGAGVAKRTSAIHQRSSPRLLVNGSVTPRRFSSCSAAIGSRPAARRAEFAGGPEEFAAYLAQREMFADFPPETLLDHARATLRPSPWQFGLWLAGTFALAFLTFFGVPFLSTAPHKGAI